MEDTPLACSVQLPCEADIDLFRKQYKKAVNGLFEAYVFGAMMLKVKATLETLKAQSVYGSDNVSPPLDHDIAHGSDNVSPPSNHGFAHGKVNPGWRAGLGLKGWLSKHCPEIHYRTALRFMEVAAKTHTGLRLAEPDTRTVRAWLSGKSQRDLLRGGKREGAGRPPKNDAERLSTDPDILWKEIELPLQTLSEFIVSHRHQHLTDQDLQTLRDALQLMLDGLR